MKIFFLVILCFSLKNKKSGSTISYPQLFDTIFVKKLHIGSTYQIFIGILLLVLEAVRCLSRRLTASGLGLIYFFIYSTFIKK